MILVKHPSQNQYAQHFPLPSLAMDICTIWKPPMQWNIVPRHLSIPLQLSHISRHMSDEELIRLANSRYKKKRKTEYSHMYDLNQPQPYPTSLHCKINILLIAVRIFFIYYRPHTLYFSAFSHLCYTHPTLQTTDQNNSWSRSSKAVQSKKVETTYSYTETAAAITANLRNTESQIYNRSQTIWVSDLQRLRLHNLFFPCHYH